MFGSGITRRRANEARNRRALNTCKQINSPAQSGLFVACCWRWIACEVRGRYETPTREGLGKGARLALTGLPAPALPEPARVPVARSQKSRPDHRAADSLLALLHTPGQIPVKMEQNPSALPRFTIGPLAPVERQLDTLKQAGPHGHRTDIHDHPGTSVTGQRVDVLDKFCISVTTAQPSQRLTITQDGL